MRNLLRCSSVPDTVPRVPEPQRISAVRPTIKQAPNNSQDLDLSELPQPPLTPSFESDTDVHVKQATEQAPMQRSWSVSQLGVDALDPDL